jgi:hypothetical protein
MKFKCDGHEIAQVAAVSLHTFFSANQQRMKSNKAKLRFSASFLGEVDLRWRLWGLSLIWFGREEIVGGLLGEKCSGSGFGWSGV